MMMQQKVIGGGSNKLLDMQMNGSSIDLMGHTVTDTDMTYDSEDAIFNGSTSKITIANSSNLIFTNGINDLPFSIDIRFATNATGVFGLYKNGGVYVYFDSNYIRCDLYSNNTFTQFSWAGVTTTFTVGVPYRLTITYDGRGGVVAGLGIKLYINNALQTTPEANSNSYTITFNESNSYIGHIGALPFNGTIDYCTIYNRVLTQYEIVNGI